MQKLPQSSYREPAVMAPEPMSEADAIDLLVKRSSSMMRRLLMVAIGGGILGGVGTVSVYMSSFTFLDGRVGGAFFCAGGIVVFAALHLAGQLVTRWFTARWAAKLAKEHQLNEKMLVEALGMLRS